MKTDNSRSLAAQAEQALSDEVLRNANIAFNFAALEGIDAPTEMRLIIVNTLAPLFAQWEAERDVSERLAFSGGYCVGYDAEAEQSRGKGGRIEIENYDEWVTAGRPDDWEKWPKDRSYLAAERTRGEQERAEK